MNKLGRRGAEERGAAATGARRFVRLQGLQAVINQMVPEMTGKTDTLVPIEERMSVYI